MPATRSATEPIVEREVDLDVVDALVPCRSFAITYKIAEVGKFSLTSEFLLRLIRIVEGIQETEAAEYFGFSASELAYVVNDMETHGYVERRQGGVWLTEAGRGLFLANSDVPELYQVEQRTDRRGFDLISLAPAESLGLSSFDAALPELKVPGERVASASKAVSTAFNKHFDRLVRRATDTPLKQSLYSVDTVTPRNRFPMPVPISVRARSSMAGAPEPNLSESWTGYDLDDRSEIVEAAATFLKSVRVSDKFATDEAFRRLAEIAPEALGEFTRNGVVRREAFFKEALRRAGELRADRATVPVIGTLFTGGNLDRLRRALGYAGQKKLRLPQLLFWHAPALPYWGATRRLPALLEGIPQLMSASSEARMRTVCIHMERPPRHIQRAFDAVVESRAVVLGLQSVEVLLVPGNVAAVIVHTATSSPSSYPVPMGILSFDAKVVARTTELVRDLLPTHAESQTGWNPDDLGAQIDGALAPHIELGPADSVETGN